MRGSVMLLRNVLLMRDVEELSISDVAVQLGITAAAAKSRLQRARSELRERMLRHCTRKWAERARHSLKGIRESSAA